MKDIWAGHIPLLSGQGGTRDPKVDRHHVSLGGSVSLPPWAWLLSFYSPVVLVEIIGG